MNQVLNFGKSLTKELHLTWNLVHESRQPAKKLSEKSINHTDLLLVIHIVGEFLLADVGIGQEHLHYCLGKPLHEPLPDLWVWALQLGHHPEALGQLGKHVHHRVGEERIFRAWRELRKENKNICIRSLYKAALLFVKHQKYIFTSCKSNWNTTKTEFTKSIYGC